MKYCIDACSLLASNDEPAAKQKYPKNLFPSLWQNIETKIEVGEIVSIKNIQVEVEVVDTSVKTWSRQLSQFRFYKNLDQTCIDEAQRIIQTYPHIIKIGNTDEADPYLIAYAKINNLTIITEENSSGATINLKKIPDICLREGVRCINLLQLIREYDWRY